MLPEINTQIAELMTGKLDFIWKIPADQADRMRDRPGLQVKDQSILRVAFIQPNIVDESP